MLKAKYPDADGEAGRIPFYLPKNCYVKVVQIEMPVTEFVDCLNFIALVLFTFSGLVVLMCLHMLLYGGVFALVFGKLKLYAFSFY